MKLSNSPIIDIFKVYKQLNKKEKFLLFGIPISDSLLVLADIGLAFYAANLISLLSEPSLATQQLENFSTQSTSFVFAVLILIAGCRLLVSGTKGVYTNISEVYCRANLKKLVTERLLLSDKPESLKNPELLFHEYVMENSKALSYLFQGLALGLYSLICFLLCIYTSPLLSLSTIPLFLFIILSAKDRKSKIKNNASTLDSDSKALGKAISSLVSNIDYFRMSGLKRHMADTQHDLLSRWTDKSTANLKIILIKKVLLVSSSVIFMGLFCYFTLNNNYLSIATLLSFFYLLTRLMQASSDGLSMYNRLQTTNQFTKTLNKFFDQTTIRRQDTEFKTDSFQLIELKNISLRYGDQVALSDIHLNFHKGNIYCLRGKSGSGKSSLLRLIANDFKPNQGAIYINKEKLENKNISKYVGYMGPNISFQAESLIKNLCLGLEAPDSPETINLIQHYLAATGLTEKIDSLPQKLETPMETPLPFSTGQLKRLELIRALLRTPQILLLDEPFANLDPVSARNIAQILLEYSKNSIVICTSHTSIFEENQCIYIDLEPTQLIKS